RVLPPAHEPPPLPPFGHPLPLGGGEGRGEGAVGWFKGARRAQSSGRSLLGERAGPSPAVAILLRMTGLASAREGGVRASVSSNPIFGVGGGEAPVESGSASSRRRVLPASARQ